MDDGDTRPLRLLSLDGGGIRGLSSLIILQHLMKKVNPEDPPKPCDYFDLIGGTSTGGLIAIMLGRLRMGVTECIDKYLQLSASAFTRKRNKINVMGKGKDLWTVNGKYRSESLVEEFRAAASEAAGDADALLFEPGGLCRVFVCTQSKALNTPVLLRSYTTADSVDGLSTTEVKIWEAARATSAASTFFDLIRIGCQEFVDGATGRNNPVEAVLAEANSIWKDAPSRIQCLVSIGTGKSQFRDFGSNLIEMKRTLVALATETEDTEQRVYQNQKNLGVGGRYFRFNVDRGLEGVVLDEYEKQGDIVTATEAYLEDPRVHALVTDFLQAKPPSYILVTEADRERYLRWLPYFDPRAAHNLARDLRTDKSTGVWFLEGHFQTWSKEPRSFTWLHAKAGSGKTVLSSTIIDALEQDHVGALAFFYFSIQNGPANLHQFKCSLLVQILRQLIRPDELVPRSYEAPRPFVELYRKYVPSAEPGMEDLDQAILSMLGLSNNAYIVVDALDECLPPELQRRVIHFLGWLSQQDVGNTRILVTSRREPDIEEAIKGLPIHKHLVPFRVGEINRDIRSHLETLLQAETFKRWADPLKEQVLDYLAEHADGVFRWADLQMQTLGRQEREKDVRKALKRLPKGLEATYEAILKRIQDEDKLEEGLAILRWLAYSMRPLTLAEAAEVAAFEVDDTDILPESDDFSVAFHPSNRLLEASSIQRILAGLVTLDEKEASRSGDVIIYLAHSSVHDYLHSSGVVPASFRLDPTNSHMFVFRTCMAYIAHYDDADAAGRKQPPYPLLGYACQMAVNHLQILSPMDNQKDWPGRLASTPTKRLGAASTLSLRFAGLHLASLPDGFSALPQALAFLEFHDVLDYAASVGELGLVKLTLDSGAAQPDHQSRWTPLHSAALKRSRWMTPQPRVPTHEIDRAGAVRELVSAGYHVNSVSSGGWTPLHVAARSGHVETVSVLLSYGNIRPDDVDEEGRTALSWAAAGGHDNIVELLGRHGDVNINAVDFRGRTALIWASSLGRTSVVTRLLGLAGIQPDERDILGRTALSWATLCGHRDIVSALRSRHDVSANPVDNEGQDLHALAQSRHDGVLPTEDAAGLEVNRHPNACTTPSDSHNLPLRSFRSDRPPPDKPTAEVENDNRPDFQAFVLGDHGHEVWFVKFSHDGSRLVAGGGFDCVVIWDLAFQMALFKLQGHKTAVTYAAWSPDDSMVVTTSLDHTAKLWDADNGALLKTLGPYDEPPHTCVWTPDPKCFFVGVPDRKFSVIQGSVPRDDGCDTKKMDRLALQKPDLPSMRWNGGAVWTDGFRCFVSAVCDDGKWLVVGEETSSLSVYDITTKKLLRTFSMPSRVVHLSASTGSPHVLVRLESGDMWLIDPFSGKWVQDFSDPEGGASQFVLGCGLGGPDETLALGCNDDGAISVFHTATGELISRLKFHDQRCNSVDWSPVDPYLFASASDDGRVLIWTSRSYSVRGDLPSFETALVYFDG